MQEISLAYIAGFFDGEGSIGIYKNSNKDTPGYGLRTQLAQNKRLGSTKLMDFLKDTFGGNLSEQVTISGDTKYNWQLNAEKAVKFLRYIQPFLLIKNDQAKLAIWWQDQRPKRIRDKNGRIALQKKAVKDLDETVSLLLKKMKGEDINEVMENSRELVKVEHTLRQIVNVKGD